MNQKQYEKTIKNLSTILLRDFAEVIKNKFADGTPKAKIIEFLSYPDDHSINFEFKIGVQVKTIRELAK